MAPVRRAQGEIRVVGPVGRRPVGLLGEPGPLRGPGGRGGTSCSIRQGPNTIRSAVVPPEAGRFASGRGRRRSRCTTSRDRRPVRKFEDRANRRRCDHPDRVGRPACWFGRGRRDRPGVGLPETGQRTAAGPLPTGTGCGRGAVRSRRDGKRIAAGWARPSRGGSGNSPESSFRVTLRRPAQFPGRGRPLRPNRFQPGSLSCVDNQTRLSVNPLEGREVPACLVAPAGPTPSSSPGRGERCRHPQGQRARQHLRVRHRGRRLQLQRDQEHLGRHRGRERPGRLQVDPQPAAGPAAGRDRRTSGTGTTRSRPTCSTLERRRQRPAGRLPARSSAGGGTGDDRLGINAHHDVDVAAGAGSR